MKPRAYGLTALQPKQSLWTLCRCAGGHTVIQGVQRVELHTARQAHELLQRAMQARACNATAMNATSSRRCAPRFMTARKHLVHSSTWCTATLGAQQHLVHRRVPVRACACLRTVRTRAQYAPEAMGWWPRQACSMFCQTFGKGLCTQQKSAFPLLECASQPFGPTGAPTLLTLSSKAFLLEGIEAPLQGLGA